MIFESRLFFNLDSVQFQKISPIFTKATLLDGAIFISISAYSDNFLDSVIGLTYWWSTKKGKTLKLQFQVSSNRLVGGESFYYQSIISYKKLLWYFCEIVSLYTQVFGNITSLTDSSDSIITQKFIVPMSVER